MLKWLIAGTLALAGICLYRGRRSWRCSWDRGLLLCVVFQIIGFMLIQPFYDPLSPWAYRLTGLAQLPDFIGHIFFVAAIGAAIISVAYRLMPNPLWIRRLLEPVAAGGAALMLVTYTLSTSAHHPGCADFFRCPMDDWLRAYWVIFGLLSTYLMSLMLYMLLVIRREYPESRLSVGLYMAATLLGVLTGTTLAAQGITGEAVSPFWRWVPFCIASALSFVASYLTLTRNKVP